MTEAETTLAPDSETPSEIVTEDKLLRVIEEQNLQIAELEARILGQRRTIDGFDKAHAHEKRELWMSLRDKYACAVISSTPFGKFEGDAVEYAEHIFVMADNLMAERDKSDEQAISQ